MNSSDVLLKIDKREILHPKYINVAIEIKKLIAEKRRARAKWHRSQAPSDKSTYNHISNRLNCKIKEERDKSFTDYITSLNRFDNTIWKPIKYLKNPRHRYIQ
jgi:vacuolar-type H+-ATPase subunit H